MGGRLDWRTGFIFSLIFVFTRARGWTPRRSAKDTKSVMKQLELEFEKACRQYARARGWVAWKNEKNGNKGIPDDSFLHPDGRFLLVEFKKDTKQKPRPEQQIWLNRFKGIAHLVGSFDDFKKILG